MQTKQISRDNCKNLASKIREKAFTPVTSSKTSIFLCGADINNQASVRYRLAKYFSDFKNSLYFELVYPEDIFEELLYSRAGQDLLSLENLLADSVDIVIIVVESSGSIAELGAFANNEKLRKKLICLIDEQYKTDKSFINQGPAKLIKQTNKGAVIYFDKKLLDKSALKINHAIDSIEKTKLKNENFITLLQLENFLLATIFLAEPIFIDDLIEIVEFSIENPSFAKQTTTIALSLLSKKRLIELTTLGYKLTRYGINKYLRFKKTSGRIKRQAETIALDNIRLEILNLKYRNKELKI